MISIHLTDFYRQKEIKHNTTEFLKGWVYIHAETGIFDCFPADHLWTRTDTIFSKHIIQTLFEKIRAANTTDSAIIEKIVHNEMELEYDREPDVHSLVGTRDEV